jgi:hypothetical protein
LQPEVTEQKSQDPIGKVSKIKRTWGVVQDKGPEYLGLKERERENVQTKCSIQRK